MKSDRSDFIVYFRVSTGCLFNVRVRKIHVYVSNHVDGGLRGRESPLFSTGEAPHFDAGTAHSLTLVRFPLQHERSPVERIPPQLGLAERDLSLA